MVIQYHRDGKEPENRVSGPGFCPGYDIEFEVKISGLTFELRCAKLL